MSKEILIIPGTDSTPRIEMNPVTNKYMIEGGSLPFNANVLYDPVIKWLNENAEKYMNNSVFELQLSYFNTPTTMKLSKIFKILEELVVEKGKNIKVKWGYLDDDDKEEIIETFSSEVEIPFELEQITEVNNSNVKNEPNKAVRKSYASATDEILIEKCTRILNFIISNSRSDKNKGVVTIEYIYNSLKQEIPKDEIEYILDLFYKAKDTFLKKSQTEQGGIGYVLDPEKNN